MSVIRHLRSITGVWYQTSAVRRLMLGVWYRTSAVRCLISDFSYQTSDVWLQMSDVRYLSSDVSFQTSDFKGLLSDVGCQMSDIRRMMSDVWCQTSDVRCLISDVCCQTSDVRCLISDGWYQTSDFRFLLLDVWRLILDVSSEIQNKESSLADISLNRSIYPLSCTVAVLALVLGSAEGWLFLFRKTVESFAIFWDSSINKLSLCNLVPDLSVAVPFLAIACTIDVFLQDIITTSKFGQSKLVM